ncbi:MAG: lipoprotein signal peptidase [Muribaculaceae bacterium]|nr:lipoprotein signal peptidase [Muribaculaceae bacterium]MDE6753634.1 lipoprotein signal peptidase [Muribaculaceae bacterium]
MYLVLAISIAVVLADQIMKVWVKTNFYMGEDLPITSWWHLKFIENNGMAFGLELWNKIVLTVGRIAAVAAFIWFVAKIRRADGLRLGFFVAVALIIAGAAGNIFDCVFYGKIFNNPMPPEIARAFPPDGGYAGWFEGRVVDMMYFPLFSFYWPDWVPGIGGNYFEFFQFIFNIADASICVGVGLLLFFYSTDASKAFHLISGKEAEAGTESVNGNKK